MDIEDILQQRSEAKTFEAGETRRDGRVVAVGERETEVAVQTAYIEVRAVQRLLHVAVGEQIAHRPIVERGQRVHETGVDAVRQLDEAYLLRVAVTAVRFSIDSDFGGRGQRCDGRIERGLIVHEAIGRRICQRSGKSMLTRITHSMMRRTGGLVNRQSARLLGNL